MEEEDYKKIQDAVDFAWGELYGAGGAVVRNRHDYEYGGALHSYVEWLHQLQSLSLELREIHNKVEDRGKKEAEPKANGVRPRPKQG